MERVISLMLHMMHVAGHLFSDKPPSAASADICISHMGDMAAKLVLSAQKTCRMRSELLPGQKNARLRLFFLSTA